MSTDTGGFLGDEGLGGESLSNVLVEGGGRGEGLGGKGLESIGQPPDSIFNLRGGDNANLLGGDGAVLRGGDQ